MHILYKYLQYQFSIEYGFTVVRNSGQIKTSSIETKVEDDLRCALANTEPEIQALVKEKQLHPSH